MLRKLMKHEFRATSRVMLPMYLMLLVTAVGARAAISGLLETEYVLLDILASLLVVAFAVAMAAVCVVGVFLMVYRFYQNLLRDEGYVMMTLPVSVHQQVWSKLLVGVTWCVLTVLAVVLSMFIMAFEVGFWEGFVRLAGEAWTYLRTEFGLNGVLVALEIALVCFLAICSAYLEFCCALAIGHSFPNHKLVWSVGAYFAMDFAVSLVSGAFVTVANDLGIVERIATLSNDAALALHTALLGAAAVCALSTAFYYVITTWFLKNRLDLE